MGEVHVVGVAEHVGVVGVVGFFFVVVLIFIVFTVLFLIFFVFFTSLVEKGWVAVIQDLFRVDSDLPQSVQELTRTLIS